MEEEVANMEERCKGCKDLEQAMALSRRMGETASEYLSILEDIALEVQGLITEMPGEVFKPVPEILLPRGLKNSIRDPREVIKQLRDLCRTGFTPIDEYTLTDDQKNNLTSVKAVSKHPTEAPESADRQEDSNQPVHKQEVHHEENKRMVEIQRDLETETNKIEDLLKDLETDTKKIFEDLKNDLETKSKKIEFLQKGLKEQSKTVEDLGKQLESKTREHEDLKRDLETEIKKNEEVKTTIRDMSDRTADISHWIADHADFSCVIPQSAHEDTRITPIMSEFMHRLNFQMDGCTLNVISKPGPDIDLSVGLPVILPCLAASGVRSDISAALKKANIASGQVILVIFHHLAPHNSKINTPTEQRLSDRTLLDQCVGMVDAVFWNGAMYDCAANHAAVRRIQQLFRWSLSMESLKELKKHV